MATKLFHIEARRKLEINKELTRDLDRILPSTIYIGYTIQYKELAEQARKLISKRVIGFSQVLGCSEIKTSAKAILLIGEARFHAINIAKSSGKPVFIFDNHAINRVLESEIEQMNNREQGKYLKFLSLDEIGILVSSKNGQENLIAAEKVKKKVESMGKKAYFFVADNISLSEMENFPIEIYINTACAGLGLDSGKIVNYKEIGKRIGAK